MSSSVTLRQGPALNDIASLILNQALPQNIYRENIDTDHKILHNLKNLLKEISSLLPNNLSRLTARDLMTDDTKLFLILRWMVKILDFPFYQKLKSSFAQIYAKVDPGRKEESKFEKMKVASMGNILENTARVRNPEMSEFGGTLAVKGVDLIRILKDLHVFTGKSQEEFISLCETGELLADLINVLEGKDEKIKGILKKPKTTTAKSANIVKVLKYLRAFPKMSGTFMWSDKEIADGNAEVIKGLIYDILAFYKKIPKGKGSSIQRNSAIASPALEMNSPKLLIQKSSPKRQTKARISEPKEYKEIYTEEMPERNIEVSEESKERISEWLVALDLGHLMVNPSGDFNGDNLRNGVIFCELAGLIEGRGSLVKYYSPKSVIEARENIEISFTVLREHDRGVPVSLLSNPNRIIRGETEAIWGLLCHIMLAYPTLSAAIPKIVFKDLPYSADEIRELQESLLAFILSKGVLDRSRMPDSFQELLPDIVSGVLLCDLVGRVIDKPITGVFRSPTTQALALSNIKKALTPLQSIRKMGMKYVWLDEEVLKGNYGVILGLLEDLHRFSDGVPPRQRGENYHKDGPYFGRPLAGILRQGKSHQKLNISLSSEVHEKQNQSTTGSRVLVHSSSTAMADLKSLEAAPQAESNPYLQGFNWLVHIEIELPANLNLTQDVIPDFKTGELLSNIIEKLERSKIPGLHPKVATQAGCLHNLSKAFGILRNKPGFPSYLCFVEEDVYRGDGEIIRAVLNEIYKIYRRTILSMKSFYMKKLALD